MYYRIDDKQMDDLGLWGREAMVFSALLYLCKNAPWKGTYTELAKNSRCGNRDTALRMLERLQQRGLIYITGDGICIAQTAHQDTQTAHINAQTAQISKRKSNQKENNNKRNYNSVGIAHAHEEEFLFPNFEDMEPLFANKIPGNTGYYKVIIGEKGYLNPKKYVQAMYEYYNAHGWPQGDKLGMMRLWMSNEQKMRHGDKPVLNESECTYMRTFLDALSQYAVVHFCDVLRGFKMTDKKAVFYFSADKAQAVAQWLMDIRIADKMTAYGREMTVGII